MKDKKIKNFLIRTPETVSLPRKHCRLTVKLQVQAGGASSLMTEMKEIL
jgi:hypothetical protein